MKIEKHTTPRRSETMKTTEYTHCDGLVIVTNGLVTHSNTPYCVVGQKPDTHYLKACGWSKQVSQAQHFVRTGADALYALKK
jgi:hypothetical protein